MNLREAGELFDRLEGILNDIRLIADWTTTSFHSMNPTNVDSAAEDWVDAVLIGLSGRHDLVMGGLERDDYYARLHELHDADADPKPDFFFNEYEIEPLEKAIKRVARIRDAKRSTSE